VWDCEYTGKTGCTYAAALKSEKEAQQQMETLPLSIQRVALTLTHNSSRTGVSSLIEELFSYLKERYQVGEVLDFGSKKSVTILQCYPCSTNYICGLLGCCYCCFSQL